MSADVYAISEVNTVVAELNEIVVIVTGTNGGSITDMVEEMELRNKAHNKGPCAVMLSARCEWEWQGMF